VVAKMASSFRTIIIAAMAVIDGDPLSAALD